MNAPIVATSTLLTIWISTTVSVVLANIFSDKNNFIKFTKDRYFNLILNAGLASILILVVVIFVFGLIFLIFTRGIDFFFN